MHALFLAVAMNFVTGELVEHDLLSPMQTTGVEVSVAEERVEVVHFVEVEIPLLPISALHMYVREPIPEPKTHPVR